MNPLSPYSLASIIEEACPPKFKRPLTVYSIQQGDGRLRAFITSTDRDLIVRFLRQRASGDRLYLIKKKP